MLPRRTLRRLRNQAHWLTWATALSNNNNKKKTSTDKPAGDLGGRDNEKKQWINWSPNVKGVSIYHKTGLPDVGREITTGQPLTEPSTKNRNTELWLRDGTRRVVSIRPASATEWLGKLGLHWDYCLKKKRNQGDTPKFGWLWHSVCNFRDGDGCPWGRRKALVLHYWLTALTAKVAASVA